MFKSMTYVIFNREKTTAHSRENSNKEWAQLNEENFIHKKAN